MACTIGILYFWTVLFFKYHHTTIALLRNCLSYMSSVVKIVFLPNCRFDLLVNGGKALTLRFVRAPYSAVYRTVWLSWRVFHVMDTLVMRKEERDTPTCEFSGLDRPLPRITASPLSTFYRSSPEASPIIPETQVTHTASHLGVKWVLVHFPGNQNKFWLCALSPYKLYDLMTLQNMREPGDFFTYRTYYTVRKIRHS